jgi:hypothetical protein
MLIVQFFHDSRSALKRAGIDDPWTKLLNPGIGSARISNDTPRSTNNC